MKAALLLVFLAVLPAAAKYIPGLGPRWFGQSSAAEQFKPFSHSYDP